MKNEMNKNSYSNKQLFALTFLRILIGWHFLYEGLVKIFNPDWTAKDYLNSSAGIFASLFKTVANSDGALIIVDLLNEWGLILIGISLFIGLFSKPAKISGVILLLMYYLAHPPFPEINPDLYVEGNYWIVNKNLIEIAALIILYFFPCSRITGMDRYLFSETKSKRNEKQEIFAA